MNLTIHRGTLEIGGTCVELRSKSTRIILDYGLPLTDAAGMEWDERALGEKTREELIKEGILFDIPGLYKGQKPKVSAILISHSHKDHYGLLDHAHPDIPVYISDGAFRLIRVLNVFTREQCLAGLSEPRTVRHNESFEIGEFRVTPYLVDHSAYDAMSFLVEEKATGKRLFYSGDFRSGGWKKGLFDRFIEDPPKNIDCLLLEGTMIERRAGEYEDEPAVLDGVLDVLERSENNVTLAYCSGQNIDRIVTLYKAARRAKAILVIDPYVAAVLHVLENSRGTLPRMEWAGIRVLVGNYRGHGDIYVSKIVRSDLGYITAEIGRKKIKALDIGREKALVLMRDSMIPIVSRIPGLEGSTLIYSLWAGYVHNRNNAYRFRDFVQKKGIKVAYIHAGGHATVEKLKQMAAALQPGRIIPIHTQRPDKFREYFGSRVLNAVDGQEIAI